MPTCTPSSDEARMAAQLVQRAQHGENCAYDALFELFYSRAFNFALGLLGNREDAADIAQTAFVRSYQALGRLRDGQAFLGWIYRIEINLVRDRAKQARRKPWIAFRDLWHPNQVEPGGVALQDPDIADSAHDPHKLTLQSEQSVALTQALAALPLELREVVVLHHLQQMDVREIKQLLRIPEGTVKSRLSRARQQLRAALAGWGDSGDEHDRN